MKLMNVSAGCNPESTIVLSKEEERREKINTANKKLHPCFEDAL